MMLGLSLSIATYYPIKNGMHHFRISTIAAVAKIELADIVESANYSSYALCFLIWIRDSGNIIILGTLLSIYNCWNHARNKDLICS
jgi:hypothetical protein